MEQYIALTITALAMTLITSVVEVFTSRQEVDGWSTLRMVSALGLGTFSLLALFAGAEPWLFALTVFGFGWGVSDLVRVLRVIND